MKYGNLVDDVTKCTSGKVPGTYDHFPAASLTDTLEGIEVFPDGHEGGKKSWQGSRLRNSVRWDSSTDKKETICHIRFISEIGIFDEIGKLREHTYRMIRHLWLCR